MALNPGAPLAELKYPTDYDLKSVILYTAGGTIDLRDRLVELNYFEDIYSSTISGQLVVSDAAGILSLGSLSGTEFLRIILQKTENSGIVIDRTFRVFSVNDRKISINNTFETYTINFCSEELLLSEQYRISKSYQSTAISDIVSDIMTTFLGCGNGNKNVYVDDTYGVYDFVLPNKKIFETINWLSIYAQPMTGGTGTQNGTGADFVFFENQQGFHFHSLQGLYSQNKSCDYFFNPKNVDISGEYPNINQKVFNAMKFEILDYFDTLGAISKGTFSNRLISLDILQRKKIVTDFNYNDYFAQAESLNGSPIVNNYRNRYGKYLFDAPPEMFESGTLRLATSNSDQVNNPYVNKAPGAVAQDIFIENYMPNRVAQVALANYQRIRITVPGNSDITVGTVINFNAYGIATTTPTDSGFAKKELDPYFSGKYLVSAVRHIITNISYITVLELAKESNLENWSGVDNNNAEWSNLVNGNQV